MSSLAEISYQLLIDEIEVSYSLNKIIYDENNKPEDLLIVDVNKQLKDLLVCYFHHRLSYSMSMKLRSHR
jgi:hypothetical protein